MGLSSVSLYMKVFRKSLLLMMAVICISAYQNCSTGSSSQGGASQETLSSSSTSTHSSDSTSSGEQQPANNVNNANQMNCLQSGDQNTINAALVGEGTVVSLCPNAVFKITAPIAFTAPKQEISTAGYPTDGSRALIQVVGINQSNAIYGAGISDIRIKNIIVDGNRNNLGRLASDPKALIMIGGIKAQNQVVDHIKAFETRGWSTLAINEGYLDCSNAQITNNEIGPAGNSLNGEWADGISLACRNSTIKGNTVTNATDGAIVVFGSPGSIISDNVIHNDERVLLGAINMVDYVPYSGSYQGTQVVNNKIIADKGYIKIGIAIGPRAWGIEAPGSNANGTVLNNIFVGNNFGYGIVVSNANGFKVQNNQFGEAKFSGGMGTPCFKENAAPQAMVVSPSAVGDFQSIPMHLGDLKYGICVSPQFGFDRGALSLLSGEQIYLGKQVQLNFQEDGNLVIYDLSGRALWATDTFQDCRQKQCHLVYQYDGNLVMYKNGVAYWATATSDAELGSNKAGILRFSPESPFAQIQDLENKTLWSK